jgi:hypothetical protein
MRYSSRRERSGRGRALAWIGAAAVIVVAVLSLGWDGGGLAAALSGAGQALQRTGLGGEAPAEVPDGGPGPAGAPAPDVDPAGETEAGEAGPAGPFAIQVASFRNAERARDYAREHRDRTGEKARVSPTEVETGLWYRVLVGEFASREEVAARMAELRKDGDHSFLRTVRLIPGEDRSGTAAGN